MRAVLALIVGSLVACSSAPPAPVREPTRAASIAAPPTPIAQAKSLWVPVPWTDLPGWSDDALHEAWPAWRRSCERPRAAFAQVCAQAQRLGEPSSEQIRAWLVRHWQAFRVELPSAPQSPAAAHEGVLTGYYEPVFDAQRVASASHSAALYRMPPNLAPKTPWFTRQEIETRVPAQAALRGREIAYLTDPLDALVLHIQGSGRLRVTEPDGSKRTVRVAFAGTNEQPYKSVGTWLLQQGALRDASWPGIKAWAVQNPHRVAEMLWSNPRYVFFREETIRPGQEDVGPVGAQGVPLTAGRSIAVDPGSIPYGTPVWLASTGATTTLHRLVLAQDTGAAIVGAVRADYYVGSGAQAGELAGRLKQPLQLWALWPKPAAALE